MTKTMLRALLVEDISDVREWMVDAVKTVFPGVAVAAAGTIKEALALVESDEFDLALIDLGLPDGSGIDVVREFKNRFELSMAVVVTIFDDNEHLFPALKAGAEGYLLKDQSKEQFIRRLEGISNGEPPLSPSIARKLLNHFGGEDDMPEPHLTKRETEVLTLIAKGIALPKVAELLGISRYTVAGYAKDIYRKLDISSRAEAAVAASRRGLIGQ